MALQILDRNVNDEIPFRGFLVGNPYVDPFSNDVTMMTTYYMHGLFPLPTYLLWQESCTDPDDNDEEVNMFYNGVTFIFPCLCHP